MKSMWKHKELSDQEVKELLKSKEIKFAGYYKGKIYGKLDCWSGKKRMKRKSRVFFESEKEAINLGYRPCRFCMKERYER